MGETLKEREKERERERERDRHTALPERTSGPLIKKKKAPDSVAKACPITHINTI